MDERTAGIDIGADRYQAEAERARERRLDDELLKLDFGKLHRGPHQLELGEGGIIRALRDIALLAQSLVALEIRLRQHQSRTRLVIGGADQFIVEFEKNGAGFDRLSVLEQDLLDPPGRLGGDVDGFVREQRADRVDVVAELGRARRCNLDG